MYDLAQKMISNLHFHIKDIKDDLKPIHDSDIFRYLFVEMRHVTTKNSCPF